MHRAARTSAAARRRARPHSEPPAAPARSPAPRATPRVGQRVEQARPDPRRASRAGKRAPERSGSVSAGRRQRQPPRASAGDRRARHLDAASGALARAGCRSRRGALPANARAASRARRAPAATTSTTKPRASRSDVSGGSFASSEQRRAARADRRARSASAPRRARATAGVQRARGMMLEHAEPLGWRMILEPDSGRAAHGAPTASRSRPRPARASASRAARGGALALAAFALLLWSGPPGREPPRRGVRRAGAVLAAPRARPRRWPAPAPRPTAAPGARVAAAARAVAAAAGRGERAGRSDGPAPTACSVDSERHRPLPAARHRPAQDRDRRAGGLRAARGLPASLPGDGRRPAAAADPDVPPRLRLGGRARRRTSRCPAIGVVPPELAPEGMPIEMLELPEPLEPALNPSARGIGARRWRRRSRARWRSASTRTLGRPASRSAS